MLDFSQFRVLDFVREQGRATRSDVVGTLGLSQPSVSRIVSKLLKMGLLQEEGGSGRTRGRPGRVLRYNAQLGAVMAFDVGGTKIHSALADLAGSVLDEHIRPTLEQGDAYSTLLAALREHESVALSRGVRVWAMAVGVPALLEPETGRVVAAPNIGWFDVDLMTRLQRDAPIPCVIENDVNLAALAQAWKGAGRGLECCVTLSIGTGVGAGIVVDGNLFRGKGGAAGEIGYLVVGSEQLRSPSEGGLGVLDSIASGPALRRRARELMSSNPGSSELEPETVTPERVLEAATRGDPVGAQVVEEFLDNLAVALIAIAAILSPDCIVLDGGVGRALEPWLEDLRRRLALRLLVVPELLVSRLGSNSTLEGGVAAALAVAHWRSSPSGTEASAVPSRASMTSSVVGGVAFNRRT
jgi:glucokinase